VESIRRNLVITFFMSIFVNIGMWFERFVIIASTSSQRLSSFKLELLHAYMGRDRLVHRDFGLVFDLLFDLHQDCAGGRHCGG
jgi:hypothetical protein